MWLLEWLFPVSYIQNIVHVVTICSLIGFIVASVVVKIPFINNYARIIKPICLLLLAMGIFFEGRFTALSNMKDKLAEMQKQIEIAEAKSQEVNEVIKTVYVDKVKIIKQKGEENVKYIETVVTKYDNLCTLSNAAISVHNSASQNQLARSPGGANEGTSDVKASTLITTVTENYVTYYQVREQLLGWQMWYNEQKKIHEGIK